MGNGIPCSPGIGFMGEAAGERGREGTKIRKHSKEKIGNQY